MSLTGLAWRSLRARPLRAVLSALGVALGVAVLFAGLATNAGIEASVDRTVRDLVGRADLRVAAFGETGPEPPRRVAPIAGDARRRGRRPGPRAPDLPRCASLDDRAALPPPVTVLGIDPVVDAAAPRPRPRRRLAADRARTSTSALSPSASPRRTASPSARRSRCRAPATRSTYRVVGILAGDGPLTGAFGRTVIVPLADRAGRLRRDRRRRGSTSAWPRRRPRRPSRPRSRRA